MMIPFIQEMGFSFPFLLFVYLIVGLSTHALFIQHSKMSLWEHLLSSLFLGTAVVTLSQFLFSLLGFKMAPALLRIFLLGLLFFWTNRKKIFLLWRPYQTSGFQLLIWVVLGIQLLLLGVKAVSAPTYTWDSIAFWTPKMIAIWRDGYVNIEGLKNFNHPEYPLYVPLLGATQFLLQGWPNDVAAKALFFVIASVGVCIFAAWSMRHFPPLKAAFWITLLGSAFILRDHLAGEYAGTADIFVGLFAMVGALRILEGNWKLGIVHFLFLAWIKSEGLVFAASLASLSFLFMPSLRRFLIGAGALILAPWNIFIRTQHVDTSQYFKFGEIYARPWLQYAIYAIHAFREEFRQLNKWNLLFWWTGAAVFTHLRKCFRVVEVRVLLFSVLTQLIMYIVIFTVTPEEQASFIAAAVSRLSLHLAPAMLAVATWLFSKNMQEGSYEIKIKAS